MKREEAIEKVTEIQMDDDTKHWVTYVVNKIYNEFEEKAQEKSK